MLLIERPVIIELTIFVKCLSSTIFKQIWARDLSKASNLFKPFSLGYKDRVWKRFIRRNDLAI